MAKFKVTRPVTVTVTDVWEGDSLAAIMERLNNGTSLAGEISKLGLGNVPGRSVKYEFGKDSVKQL